MNQEIEKESTKSLDEIFSQILKDGMRRFNPIANRNRVIRRRLRHPVKYLISYIQSFFMKSKNKAVVLSLYEIVDRYKTKEDAIRYFEKMRWGDKPVCVKCGCTGRITAQKKAGDYWCGDCRSYFNAFTGTPLERNKVDPRKWMYATYTLMTSRKGISSLQLSKEIGVQQRTAWYMLHRLRLACGSNLEALSGEVEMDAYLYWWF